MKSLSPIAIAAGGRRPKPAATGRAAVPFSALLFPDLHKYIDLYLSFFFFFYFPAPPLFYTAELSRRFYASASATR